MKCLICYKVFYKRRTLLTLFNQPHALKCESCDRKYPFHPNYSVLPIEDYQCYLIDLSIDKKINDEAYMLEISAIVNELLVNMRPNDTLLYLSEMSESFYSLLEKINYGDIYAICLNNADFLV
ncbi:MAG: hypothetical protein RBQ91_02005 [Acholeplasma sp.]|nr:hypothetical protein [Acholeplasma sp.]